MTGNGELRDARKGQPAKTGGCKLGRKQESAIAALLTERTHADAAAKAGISEATLARWLRVPAFIVAYRAARLRVVEAAIARLQRATGAAVRALTRNLRCGFPSAEIRAADLILAWAARGVELIDLAERVAALELRNPPP